MIDLSKVFKPLMQLMPHSSSSRPMGLLGQWGGLEPSR